MSNRYYTKIEIGGKLKRLQVKVLYQAALNDGMEYEYSGMLFENGAKSGSLSIEYSFRPNDRAIITLPDIWLTYAARPFSKPA